MKSLTDIIRDIHATQKDSEFRQIPLWLQARVDLWIQHLEEIVGTEEET